MLVKQPDLQLLTFTISESHISFNQTRSSGPWAWQVEILEGEVPVKEKKAEEASKGLVETERILMFARTRVEAADREVAGKEQQLKEARKRLTNNQENAVMASLEERYPWFQGAMLVRTSGDTRRSSARP